MPYTVVDISKTLKATREAGGMSQRALGAASGVPQSHISKIEAGRIDLRLSSLIELARALDLDVMLVPRKFVPWVRSLPRGAESAASTEAARSRERLEEGPFQRPAYSLDEEDDDA